MTKILKKRLYKNISAHSHAIRYGITVWLDYNLMLNLDYIKVYILLKITIFIAHGTVISGLQREKDKRTYFDFFSKISNLTSIWHRYHAWSISNACFCCYKSIEYFRYMLLQSRRNPVTSRIKFFLFFFMVAFCSLFMKKKKRLLLLLEK